IERNTNSGTADQNISSFIDPCIRAGRSAGWRRRYFSANPATPTKITMVMITVTAVMYQNNGSCSSAKVDAISGRILKCISDFRAPVPTQADEHECAEQCERRRPGHPHRLEYGNRVFALRGIVVVTKQQNLICKPADFILRSLDEREPQVARLEIDTVQVSR